GVVRWLDGEAVEQRPTPQPRDVVGPGYALEEQADVHEHLTQTVGERLQVDAAADHPRPLGASQRLEHGPVDGRREVPQRLYQLVAGTRRGFVEREEQRGPVAAGAGGDLVAERHDGAGRIGRLRRSAVGARSLSQVVEIGVVALDQLDDQGLLRLEVVVQAAGQDAARVGDLLERGAKAG